MALRGINVIEFAGLAPAPFCGMILADFGARVTRIDKPGSNTDLDCLGNGKESLALNLKHPKSVQIIRKLCIKSDVLIEPFRKGVMEKLGLGPEILLKDNPRLIYARLTGYGQSGIYSERAGHDINYLGMSGLLSLFGRHGEKPVFPANLAADFGGGGLLCALGILLALQERNSSGLGQVIDCNMVQGTSYLGSWLYRSQKLPIWGRERGKNFLDTGAHFYEVYETQDAKYMAVGALEPQFYDQLLQGLGLNEEDCPQHSDFDELKAIFQKIFKTKTQEEWCEIFDPLDACVSPVLSLNEAPLHPHNNEKESFQRTTEGLIPKPAPKLGRTPGKTKAIQPSPQIGQHTKLILTDLGFKDSEISELEAEGAVECSTKSKL